MTTRIKHAMYEVEHWFFHSKWGPITIVVAWLAVSLLCIWIGNYVQKETFGDP